MKKFLIRLIFNKRQREIIWNAIVFSQHTYKRRGDIDNASEVGVVINETEKLFTEKEPKFTLNEICFIYKELMSEKEKSESDEKPSEDNKPKKEEETATKDSEENDEKE